LQRYIFSFSFYKSESIFSHLKRSTFM